MSDLLVDGCSPVIASSDFQTANGGGDQLCQRRIALVGPVSCGEDAVDAEQKEGRTVEGVYFRMHFSVAARPLDRINEKNDHGMIAPVILGRARRREMQRQKLFE